MKTSLYDHMITRLSALDVIGSHDGDALILEYKGVKSRYYISDEYHSEFQEYIRLRDGHFDCNDFTYVYGNCVDVPLIKLDQDIFRDDVFFFSDQNGDEVIIQRARLNYMLAFFDSEEYEDYFHRFVVERITEPSRHTRSLLTLLRRRPVATFSSLLAISPSAMRPKGFERIKACLLKLAVESHACFEFYVKPRSLPVRSLDFPKTHDGRIPSLNYEPALSNYYKVGRSSPLASQSFLAYYHVLEYYFLRVSEGALHDRLRALLNSPSFESSTDGIDKAISLVRKHAGYDDETEMLRKVLNKFVAEDDFIQFIVTSELAAGEKIFTKKYRIFGELLEISAKEGHAISNAAKLLKHIRNAIVHSTDKYSRDECHIPLTHSEDIVAQYVPIVKYFAEQVIYGTATPQTKYL